MKTINTALLSFGMSGRVFHAPFVDVHPGFTLAGAWERSKKQIRQHYPNVKSYNSFESILDDDSIELVVVNTPTYTHYEYARRALEAGKHVIVEKAFTTTVTEAKELDALAKAKGKMLSVYQNRRWDSDFSAVRNVISEGVLGELVEVAFSYERYKENLSPKLHKETKGPGAGLLYDLGPHLIDQALSLFGMPGSVFATLAIRRRQSAVDDFFELILFYTGFMVRLRSTYFAKEPGPAFVVHGSNGSFVKSRTDIQEADLQKGKRPDLKDWGMEVETDAGVLNLEGKERQFLTSPRGNYMAYYDGIYQAITNSKTPPVTAEDGIRVMEVIEAAFQSDREKRLISIR